MTWLKAAEIRLRNQWRITISKKGRMLPYYFRYLCHSEMGATNIKVITAIIAIVVLIGAIVIAIKFACCSESDLLFSQQSMSGYVYNEEDASSLALFMQCISIFPSISNSELKNFIDCYNKNPERYLPLIKEIKSNFGNTSDTVAKQWDSALAMVRNDHKGTGDTEIDRVKSEHELMLPHNGRVDSQLVGDYYISWNPEFDTNPLYYLRLSHGNYGYWQISDYVVAWRNIRYAISNKPVSANFALQRAQTTTAPAER